MKTCSYCISEMADAAAVCGQCTRPYLLGAGEIMAMSAYLTLGRMTSGEFAIWSLPGGGQPLFTFEGTEKGWNKAAKQWDSLHRDSPGGFMGISFPIG